MFVSGSSPACSSVVSDPSPTLSPTDPVPRGLLTLCPRGSSYYIQIRLLHTDAQEPSPVPLSPTDPVPRGLLTPIETASSDCMQPLTPSADRQDKTDKRHREDKRDRDNGSKRHTTQQQARDKQETNTGTAQRGHDRNQFASSSSCRA